MDTFRLTRARLLAWHQHAREDHQRDERTQCLICGYQEGRQPWHAVVQWLKKEGFHAS